MSASSHIDVSATAPDHEPTTRPGEMPRRILAPAHRPEAANQPAPTLTQQQARVRRLNGYSFVLVPAFDLAREVEAIVSPVSPRVTNVLTGRRYSDATKERVEHYCGELLSTVETGVGRIASTLKLPAPAKLPTFGSDYLNTSDHTLATLLVAHAELVAPVLSSKLSRFTADDLEVATWSPPGSATSGADRLASTLVPVIRTLVMDSDRHVRVLRSYCDKLDKLAAPIAGAARR